MRLKLWIHAAIAFVIFFDVAWLWQKQNGAYGSEFGGHPDEAAHYVTGLLFRDYAFDAFPSNPMRYAEEYYRHYPKIGLGMWPPGFYILQTAWMAMFGIGKSSILLMMALITTVLALQVYLALRDEFGEIFAALGGVILLCQPLLIEHYSMLMVEPISAVLILWGAMLWGRYLQTEKGAYALWFGVIAGVATMFKGSGLALAIQAVLAVAFMRSWKLLLRPAVFGGALVTALIAGPWTYKFRNIGPGLGGWLEPRPSWHFTSQAVPMYLGKFAITFGALLLLLCVIGMVAKAREPGARPWFWSSMAALLFAILIFQFIIPVGLEARHLIPSFAPTVMFAIAGLEALRKYSRSLAKAPVGAASWTECAASVVLAAAGIWLAHRWAAPDPKKWSGFADLAQAVIDDPKRRDQEILISSDGRGEGMFISELAMREKRPGHVVRRVSKDLATMDWEGRRPTLKYPTDEEALQWFRTEGRNIGIVIVDASMTEARRGPHHDQMIHLCERYPDMFWRRSESTAVREGKPQPVPIRLYQVRRPAS